jgi:polyribonucleotide 5'-hydroxyl-kinase
VVELDQAQRERIQTRELHAYMYGESITPPAGVTSYLLGGELHTELGLAPTSSVVSFDELAIYRIGEGF